MKLKKMFLIMLVLFGCFISCGSDDENKDLNTNVCTECSASFNGMTTTPAQFCGPEKEVAEFEKRYHEINKNATVKCKRK